MESLPRPQRHKYPESENTNQSLEEKISKQLRVDFVEYEQVDDTYYIETDLFRLSYTEDDELFEIRNIEIITQGLGLGSEIVKLLCSYAKSRGLDIIASNVKPEARGFWMKLGFQKGSEPGEYFKV